MEKLQVRVAGYPGDARARMYHSGHRGPAKNGLQEISAKRPASVFRTLRAFSLRNSVPFVVGFEPNFFATGKNFSTLASVRFLR